MLSRILARTLGLSIVLCVIALPLLAPSDVWADTEQMQLEQKAQWQGRYRMLRREEARLQEISQTSRENYARAGRRNYPRGGARQQYMVDAQDAEKKLVTVKEEIAQILASARHDAIPPTWIYEDDEEPINLSSPASASGDGNEEVDRAGRNPLYLPD